MGVLLMLESVVCIEGSVKAEGAMCVVAVRVLRRVNSFWWRIIANGLSGVTLDLNEQIQ